MNVTSIEHSGGVLIGNEAGNISCGEHTMKKGIMGWIREEFRKAGWTMLCGPADESRKKAAVGLGVIHNDKGKVIK